MGVMGQSNRQSHLRYGPPAVEFPVRRSVFVLALALFISILSLCLFAIVAIPMWSAGSNFWRWVALGSLFLAMIGLMFANIACWRRMATGSLQWDQKKWTFRPLFIAGKPQHADQTDWVQLLVAPPQIILDFQWALLLALEVHESSTQTFLWLERRHAPKVWLDLRRALCFTSKAL